jgi:hypothetical protein
MGSPISISLLAERPVPEVEVVDGADDDDDIKGNNDRILGTDLRGAYPCADRLQQVPLPRLA